MLELFARGPDILSEALRQCPRSMWRYRPGKGRWSIHEIILHLVDCDASAYLRCRQFIAEPGTTLRSINIPGWTTTLGYYQSTIDALGVIARLRRMSWTVLRLIPDPVWRNVLHDADKGAVLLGEWAEVEAKHIPHYVEQIRQNHIEWQQLRPQHRRRHSSTAPVGC